MELQQEPHAHHDQENIANMKKDSDQTCRNNVNHRRQLRMQLKSTGFVSMSSEQFIANINVHVHVDFFVSLGRWATSRSRARTSTADGRSALSWTAKSNSMRTVFGR